MGTGVIRCATCNTETRYGPQGIYCPQCMHSTGPEVGTTTLWNRAYEAWLTAGNVDKDMPDEFILGFGAGWDGHPAVDDDYRKGHLAGAIARRESIEAGKVQS